MNRVQSILVGLDFSECSLIALAQTVRIARRNSARLHVSHSVEGLINSDAALASNIPYDQLQSQAVAEARTAIGRHLQATGAPGNAETLVHVLSGSWGRFPLIPDACEVSEEALTKP